MSSIRLLAAMHGPVALFAIGQVPAWVGRKDLMGAAQTAGFDRLAREDGWGAITLRPFPAIKDEHYRLYLNVEG